MIFLQTISIASNTVTKKKKKSQNP